MDERFDPDLDPEELAEAQALAAAAEEFDKVPRLGTELIIHRRAHELMLPVLALMLALIIAAMGQSAIAAGVAVVVIALFVVRGSRRINRISIGADGSSARRSCSRPAPADAFAWHKGRCSKDPPPEYPDTGCGSVT